MRLLFALVFSFLIGACIPRKAENPAANAPTYSGDTYYEDLAEVLGASSADKVGLKLRAHFHDVFQDDVKFEVALPEKMDSPDQVQIYQEAVQRELERVEAFLKKYQTPFRLRFKDGDLKLFTATSTTQVWIESLKKTWVEAQSRLHEIYRNAYFSAAD